MGILRQLFLINSWYLPLNTYVHRGLNSRVLQLGPSMKARWSLLIPAGALLVLVLAVAAAFVQVHRARTRAGRYLVFILPLRIGSTYDIVVRQLRDADIPTTLPSECHTECGIELRFLNTLQTGLHLAPPTALVGDLSFRDGK